MDTRIGGIMGGLSSIIDSLTGQTGAAAATQAGELQAEAFREAVPGIETAITEAQTALAPFQQAGVSALEQQQALLGLTGPEAQQAALQAIQESPAQQFLRERQERALLRSASAIGGLGGGNIRTALQQQAAGFAQQDIQNQLAQLSGLTGMGAGAAGQVGQLGLGGAQAIGQLGIGAAQAGAAGLLGGAQAQQQGISNLVQLGTTAAILSDENLKEDISELDLKACYDAVINMPLKAWRYIESAGVDRDLHIGPMAQHAPECIKIEGKEALNLHDELMLIAGALQYAKNEGLLNA